MFRGLVRYAVGASGKASRTLALSLRLLIRINGSGGLRLRWRTLRNTLKPSTPGNSQSTITRSYGIFAEQRQRLLAIGTQIQPRVAAHIQQHLLEQIARPGISLGNQHTGYSR